MREETVKKILLAVAAILTTIFCLAPFIYMVLTSLSGNPDFLLPSKPVALTLTNFMAVIFSESAHFLAYLRNSLIISAVTAVATVFLASLAAYGLARMSLPGKTVLLLCILALSMFPPISLISYLFKLMSGLGWVNTYPGLILPYIAWCMPLSLWILVSYFAQVPIDLDRSARIDGASRFQTLIKIILPVAAPGVFSTTLLVFIFAFNEFLFALMLTVDYRSRTIPVGIALFEGIHGQIPWGEIMAAATLTTIPVVILTLIFQRRIVQGLTRGAVKQ
jgi:multiple sugar transport system permease protein